MSSSVVEVAREVRIVSPVELILAGRLEPAVAAKREIESSLTGRHQRCVRLACIYDQVVFRISQIRTRARTAAEAEAAELNAQAEVAQQTLMAVWRA